MRAEYDITNELGPQNWLDVVAGEAVLFGHQSKNPELVAKGTHLNKLIRSICYDDDGFYQVVAFGKELEKELLEKRNECKTTLFIDNLYVGSEKEKSLYEWEYDFLSDDRGYQIQMTLPVYYDEKKLMDPVKVIAEKWVADNFEDSNFLSCDIETRSAVYDSQTLIYKKYFDNHGKVVKRSVDFNHEECSARGWNEYYYFDDFGKALKAWQGVRKAFISSQKK